MRRCAPTRLLFLEVDVGHCLPVSVADDEALPFKLRVWIVDRPGRRGGGRA
jgi:hypothetical protein